MSADHGLTLSAGNQVRSSARVKYNSMANKGVNLDTPPRGSPYAGFLEVARLHGQSPGVQSEGVQR